MKVDRRAERPTKVPKMTRRSCLGVGASALLGPHLISWRVASATEDATAGEPIRPGDTRVRRPVVGLHFDDDAGLAQWWLPELVLLGNTDISLHADGPIAWKQNGEHWKYDHVNSDQRMTVVVTVERVQLGWQASLTIGNRTDEVWNDVVSPICLLLCASSAFADENWKRTYFRSDGEFLTYYGRETESGRDIFRMSLVKGQKQIERTSRHINKWGFTKRLSDDGIFAVVAQNRSTVLTTTWEPTHHLQANQQRTFSCIHANPYFGRIGPGETITRKGCVLLVPGTLAEAWAETKAVMASIG